MNSFDETAIGLLGKGGYKIALWVCLTGMLLIAAVTFLPKRVTMMRDDADHCEYVVDKFGNQYGCGELWISLVLDDNKMWISLGRHED